MGKNISNFKEFSINEEFIGKAKKFFTGYENREERAESIEKFKKDIEIIEDLVSKNPNKYAFDKDAIEKRAGENNYKGSIRIQKGGRDSSKYYVVYDDGKTSVEKIGGMLK